MSSGYDTALRDVWATAQRDHGGANALMKLLLSLYNGPRFPFDLTELRRLDPSNFEAALQVLRLDYAPGPEIHHHIAAVAGLDVRYVGHVFERRARELGLKKAATKAQIAEQQRWLVEVGVLQERAA